MPRKRKEGERKVGKVPGDVMKAALDEIMDGKKTIRKAAGFYDIALSTLRRYVKKATADPLERFSANYEVNRVFSLAEEKELFDYVMFACKIFHGLTKKQIKSLAYQLAVKNNKTFPRSWELNEEAGEDWLKGFRKRFPGMTLRAPEATSLARITAFNKTSVSEFYENVKEIYSKMKHCLHPSIYNLDETCLMTVQKA